MKNLSIRKANRNDFDELFKMDIEFISTMRKYYSKKERRLWNKKSLNFAKRKLRSKVRNKSIVIFVVEYNKQLIGYACGSIKKEVFGKKKYCEIETLFVKKKFRGKRLGKILLVKLIKEMKKRGVKKFYADVICQNRNARELFQKLGFNERSLSYFKQF